MVARTGTISHARPTSANPRIIQYVMSISNHLRPCDAARWSP
jgi:hypothetical protein